jgi:LmbE family N-acetylglucosaminyl deacetylase
MVGQNHEHKGARPVAVYCFTQLIQPGKREEAKAIFEEIRETRRSEYEASRRRLGIREEKVWFQGLPQGDMAVVYWEGGDPRAALQEFASSDDPFDEWLRERGGRSTTSNRARRWKPTRRSLQRRSARGR